MEQKKDLHTGETFIAKRITQQFAVPENRIKYYNNKAKQMRRQRAVIDKPLHQNYLVLTRLLGDKSEAEFHIQYLEGAGYNFKVVTHSEHYNKDRYPAVYCFIIISLANNMVKIVKRNGTL